MDDNGEHHVARIDDIVTSANLHKRAARTTALGSHRNGS
jgi:hypothetical protein